MSVKRSSLQPNDEHVTRVAGSQTNDWKELDELLGDLPPGIPLLSPEDAGNFEKYTNRPARVYAQGEGWKNCARALENYDAELCKGYREEIDTLLVFAGLFSAVVTAFTIESYQWLQPDSTDDAIVVLLAQIAQSVSPNSTAAPLSSISSGLPGSVSVRINVYWFLALMLSLSAALVAILCKQWIREFERNTGLTPRQFVAIHQTKLEGLENWMVGGIISLLPLLLQLALAIFALGILELLWQLHSVVAILVCVPTVVVFLFYGITTLLPALQYPHFRPDGPLTLWQKLSECPYKSPQAMLAFRARDSYLWLQHAATSRVSYVLSLAYYRLVTGIGMRRDAHAPCLGDSPKPLLLGFESWHGVSLFANYRLDLAGELMRPASLYRSLRWILWNLNDGDIAEWVWHCIWEAAASGDEPAVRQGLQHVSSGSTDVPASGARALALGELSLTGARPAFVVEAFTQNLALLDPHGAAYAAERIAQMPGLRLDLQEAAALLRALAAYARAHAAGADLAPALLGMAALVALHPSRPPADCALALFLGWLRAQPAPYRLETVAATERAVLAHCGAHLVELEMRRPPRLRALAELLWIYAVDMLGAADPAAELAARLFPVSAQERMRPVVRELLDLAAAGTRTVDRILPSSPSGPSHLPHGVPTLRNPARDVGFPAYSRHTPAEAAGRARRPDAARGSDATLHAVAVHGPEGTHSGRMGEALTANEGDVGIDHEGHRADTTGSRRAPHLVAEPSVS